MFTFNCHSIQGTCLAFSNSTHLASAGITFFYFYNTEYASETGKHENIMDYCESSLVFMRTLPS